jgi:ARG and Rhodanese-Phosphatase-superfamily-associated Protein domain
MNLDIVVKDPVTRGALALFPLFADAPSAPAYLTGPEAETAGTLHVAEHDGTAMVPALLVHNTGLEPVLLLEGETVIGAKQNRTLNVSVLVPAGQRLAVPVSCVEAGRWDAARPTARSPRHSPSDLRRINAENVSASRRAGAGRHSDQQAVWNRVEAYQSNLRARSATSSLEDVYGRVEVDLRELAHDIAPLPHQRGVVVAVGATVRGVDWFDKSSTLAAYWTGLLSGYAIDALHTPAASVTIAHAEAFLARVLKADTTTETGHRARPRAHDRR